MQLGDDDFHEFDPYSTLVEISELLATLSFSHNQLVDDYVQSKKTIQGLNRRIHLLEKTLKDKP